MHGSAQRGRVAVSMPQNGTARACDDVNGFRARPENRLDVAKVLSTTER
jgi:hypothetical protein